MTRRRPDSLRIDGATALVTGGAQGIGFSVARELTSAGASVALVDIDRGAVARAAADLGDNALALSADVRDRRAMSEAVAAASSHFGTLDVVVANAGVTPSPGTLRTLPPDEFDRVIDINLTGVYNTVTPALDLIVANRGHIVVVTSCAAFTPGAGGSPYMISKAAVEQLGRALRVELAPHGATAGLAYFGLVETTMTHAMLDEDDLGRAINDLLPWPLNRRITADTAARTIVAGITRRATSTVAPEGWRQYSWLRGMINPLIDRHMATSRHLHSLIRRLEDRAR